MLGCTPGGSNGSISTDRRRRRAPGSPMTAMRCCAAHWASCATHHRGPFRARRNLVYFGKERHRPVTKSLQFAAPLAPSAGGISTAEHQLMTAVPSVSAFTRLNRLTGTGGGDDDAAAKIPSVGDIGGNGRAGCLCDARLEPDSGAGDPGGQRGARRRIDPGFRRHMGPPDLARFRAAAGEPRSGDEPGAAQRRQRRLPADRRLHQSDPEAARGGDREGARRDFADRGAVSDPEQPVLARRGAVRAL